MVAVIFSTRGNFLNARCPGPEFLIASLVMKLVFHPGEVKIRPHRWLIFKGLVEFLANALWAALLSSISGPSKAQPLCLLAWRFSPEVSPAHVQQERFLPTIGGAW